ncbi:FAD-dependent monooxygenase [Paeniglutamicibacter kerguelensis]|uniref:2-polyprenyl-6-methoxyphenol hydroxylase-like FAD-dependent oxidoreductase n=1 Tax=Paeniglutamicibacter kerguelensis TaxID=254788 RepID=A0ABS4XDF5_9MICC|nr:FAD-dependent monooxygenase [Paeniglutamicibacter kerguelensis]MBP2385674.1 2-polyprenyl-6-methoxyphenol hydroxylase-like FAD-dependent oxidoreductase [Paeniglutamicibacter kerguelensis]
MPDVIVVGSGPAGMMLAGELALAGVGVAIMERRPTGELAESRAGGFHSRTIEILDQRGIADRFLAEGKTGQTARFGSTVLDISDFPTRHPYGLGLWQSQMQPILEGWIDQLGVIVHRGCEVVGFVQDESGVDVDLADGQKVRAAYLVGADGGRSMVRKNAGIDFPGWDATRSNLIAEVQVSEEPPSGMLQDETGVHGFTLLEDGRRYRVITTEQQLGSREGPGLTDLGNALRAAYGTDFGVHSPTSISRFTDATRQAATYRKGRVLLAGDAAHVHYPAGGQGIGLGLQDAVNLGWKLAQVVKGISLESLLDTYHSERHSGGARALKHSMAQTALQRLDARTAALAETVGELMSMDQPRRHVAALIHGLDITYDLGEGHPLLGRRMPDLDLDTANGPTRVFTLLHDAKPVLLNFAEPNRLEIAPRAGRVQLVDARFAGAWRLPLVGEVTPPTAVLIRPDGYVAWVGQGTDQGLADALDFWFGPGLPVR